MIVFLINFVEWMKNIKLLFWSLSSIIEHKNTHLLYDFLILIIVCIFICLCGKFSDVSVRNPVKFVDTGRVDGFIGGGNFVFNVSFLDYNIQVVLSFLYFILYLSFIFWLIERYCYLFEVAGLGFQSGCLLFLMVRIGHSYY